MARLKNQRHEMFAQNIVKGMSQHDAYVNAGFKPTTTKATYVRASQLVRKVKIKARIDELEARIEIGTILSIQERKEILSQIALGCLTDYIDSETGEIDHERLRHNPRALLEYKKLVTSGKDWESIRKSVKLHNPIQAIQELNKMGGDYPAEKRHIEGELTVTWKPLSDTPRTKDSSDSTTAGHDSE